MPIKGVKKDKLRIDLIRTIKNQLQPDDKYPPWFVVIETRKIAGRYKMIVGGVYCGTKLEFQGSITNEIDKNDLKFQQLPDGKIDTAVITLAARGKSLFEQSKDFLKRTFEEGNLMDVIKIVK